MNENSCNKNCYIIIKLILKSGSSVYRYTYIRMYTIHQSFSANIPDEAHGHVVCFMQITGRVLRTCEFVCK